MSNYTANEIARWLILKSNSDTVQYDSELITPLKLQKLLYYAQGVFMGYFDREDVALFDDDFYAWEHGPVIPNVYNKYNGRDQIAYVEQDGDKELLSRLEEDKKTQEILELAYDRFGRYSAWFLRNKTHQEPPWRNAESGGLITKKAIKDYFVTIFE